MKIVGLHVSTGKFHNEVVDFHKAVQPNFVLFLEPAVDTLLAVRDVSPGTQPIGREWRGPDSAAILTDPRQAARDLIDLMRTRPDWPYIRWWVGHNEPDTYNWETFTGMAEFELRMADMLHYEGKQYAGLSWGRGHPPHYWFTKAECEARDIPYFPWENLERYYYPVFEKLDGFCSHEYTYFGFLKLVNGVWTPDYADEGYWQLNRHRHWWDRLPKELQKPVLKTEGCIDAGDRRPRGEQGWKAQWAPAHYLADMIACGQYMATRPEVKCYLMYQIGSTDPQWDSFAHDGEIMRMMTDTLPKTEQGGETMPIIVPDNFWQSLPHTATWYMERALEKVKWLVLHNDAAGIPLPTTDVEEQAYALTLAQACLNPDNPHGNLPGIPYHYLIFPSGRWLKVCPLDRAGWHCGVSGDPGNLDENLISIGIAFAGDYSTAVPTTAARTTGEWLVGVLKAGLPNFEKILPHRDVPGAQTNCPGNTLAMWARGLAQPILPPSSTPTTPPAGTVIARIEALEAKTRALQDQSFTLEERTSKALSILAAITKAIQDAGL